MTNRSVQRPAQLTKLKINDVIRALKKKGFKLSDNDHKHFVLYVDGKKTTIRTEVSQGEKEIGDVLIHLMSIQMKLDKKQFEDFINCPLSYERYKAVLQKQDFLLI